MTTIYLTATDQLLAVSQKPKIASGDLNSVKVHIDFDSKWNRYTGKTAVFYTSNDPTRYETLILSDECTVPHEVLHKECTLFIGVKGVSTDGGAVKTSTIVKYKIAKGADTGAMVVLPTPEIYQQFIDSVEKNVNPYVKAKVAELENEVDGFLAEARTFLSGDVLWENPNTSADFVATSIQTMNFSEYKRIKVVFKQSKNDEFYSECICSEKDKKYTAIVGDDTENFNLTGRCVTFTDKSITFSNGFDFETKGHLSSYCIPCKVVGFKY